MALECCSDRFTLFVLSVCVSVYECGVYALDNWSYCYVGIWAAREVDGEGSDVLAAVTVAVVGDAGTTF